MTAVSEMCRSGQHVLAVVGLDHRGGCKGCADESRHEREESKVGRMRRLLLETPPPREGWQAQARCGGEDPTLFLPVDGRGQQADAIAAENARRHELAKAVCWECPVRLDCLGFALHGGQNQYGTWGSEFFIEADWTAAKTARKELGSE